MYLLYILILGFSWVPTSIIPSDLSPSNFEQAPSFNNGMATLKTLVGDKMGDPLESERILEGTSTEQVTTTGLAYYVGDTNTPTFTSDGIDHWALSGGVLYGWQSGDVSPPPSAWVIQDLQMVEQSVEVSDPWSYLWAIAPDIAPRLGCIISHESGWNPWAKSPRSTASGLAQFLSSTWAITPQGREGYSVFNALKNVEAAVWLYRNYGPTQWEVYTKGYCH